MKTMKLSSFSSVALVSSQLYGVLRMKSETSSENHSDFIT